MKAKLDAIIQQDQAEYLDGLLTQKDPLLAEMEAYAAEHRVPIADREVARFIEITAGISKDGIVESSDAEIDGLRVPFTADFREDRREFERRYISRCLEYTQGNVTRAAEILDMHRQSLQHKLRQLGLGRRYVSVSGDAQDNPDS